MRIAYLDCMSGISGDMTLAALIDAGVDTAAIQAGIDSLGLPSCQIVVEEVKRRGFRAKHVRIEHEPEHKHRHLSHIEAMIAQSALTVPQKDLACRIFQRLGHAEAKVHGTTVEKVHFHEVGAVDSIADVVGSAIGWDLLGVDAIYCSPIPVGSGFVEIAHGRVSIPAPATAELLRGVPIANSTTEGELTTPTGAAIAATICTVFGPVPAMTIQSIGYGAGTADFPQANIIRLLVGEMSAPSEAPQGTTETICVLETNLDDLTGEAIGFCAEKLWSAGALDVVVTPIQMKKGRPGTMISVQCPVALASELETILFMHTQTLGIRRSEVVRHVLIRTPHSIETKFGPIQGKCITLADGSVRFSPDYESCKAIANASGKTLQEIWFASEVAWQNREC